MFAVTMPMLFDTNGNNNPPGGPGLINSNTAVDFVGFLFEISAVQFFHVWSLVTMKRLERCPIDEWSMRREEARPDGNGPLSSIEEGFPKTLGSDRPSA